MTGTVPGTPVVAPPPGPDATDAPAATGPVDAPLHGSRSATPPWQLLLVAAAALLVAVVALRPWPLDRPLVYEGDLFQHLAMVQAGDLTGTPGHSADLAAPDGVDWSSFPTGTERLHLVVLRALDAATGNVFVALNLAVLLGVAATAVTAFAVLRRLSVLPLLAAAAGIVFSLSPGFTQRLIPGHLFLYALFPIPLGIFVALWASERGPRDLVRNRRLLLPLGACAVIALSSAYYATFSVVCIVGLGALVSLRRRDVRRLVVPVLAAAVIVGVAAVSLAPALLARAGDPTADALVRTAADAQRYALQLPQLLSPRPDHPVPALAAWGQWALPANAPGDLGSILGLVGVIGLLATVAVGARRALAPRDQVDRDVVRLAALIGVTISVAVVGGLGPMAASLGFTQIRAWSRMAAFVAFLSLAGLCLLAQRTIGPRIRSPLLRGSLVVVVALLALVDQGVVLPAGAAVERAQRSDAALVAGLSHRLGPHASVLQLPVVSFPDDPGAERLLAPAVQDADGLRFSAGFFRGGGGDWQTSLSTQPAGRLVRGAAAAGYDALLVQRTHHLVPSDGSLERELGSTLGPPTARSEDGAFVWWDLRPLRADLVAAHGSTAVRRAGDLVTRPVGVSFEGTTELRTSGRVMGNGGAVVLRRLDDDRTPVRLHLVVSAPPGARVRVGDDRSNRVVGPDGRIDASVQVDLRPREVVVPVERVDGGGTEVKVSDVTVEDLRALDDPVLGLFR